MTLLTDECASPSEIARALEARGFESLFVGEHTHLPSEPRTPYPGEGGALPPGMSRTYDPFTSLVAAATATTDLRLGTSICELAVYDPILLAKVIATVDRLSGGRFVLGAGYGWNVQEIENHGVAYSERRDVLHENVEAMTAIWTQDVASYAGRHVSFDKIWSWPKPVQSPRPPVLLGARGPKAIAAAVRSFDGWLPSGYDNFVAGLPLLREACEAAGRDVATMRISVTDRHPDRERLRFYAEHGVERLIVSTIMTPFTTDNLDAELDALAHEVKDYLRS
jgi:probable F420-dependent oxidoreductase